MTYCHIQCQSESRRRRQTWARCLATSLVNAGPPSTSRRSSTRRSSRRSTRWRGATSASATRQAEKPLNGLKDQRQELLEYQERLQHLADQRIEIDLDDGVAYNYTRFDGLVYKGSDLKMADVRKRSQWKRDLPAATAE